MTVLLTWTPTRAEMHVIEQTWPRDLPVVVRSEVGADYFERLLPTVQVMVGYMVSIPRDRIAEASSLRLIHVLGHGVDALMTADVTDQLRRRAIPVARSNPCSVAIAEFTLMNMMVLSRRLLSMHDALVRRGDWSLERVARRGEGVLGGELHGSTLGIVGYGNIGREIHRRATAFGMRVGCVARRPDALASDGLDFVEPWDLLSEFLGCCDFVVLCVPLTPSTRHLLDAEKLAAMRPGAFLINVGRGPLVDEDALADALESGRLGGAALDVFEAEEVVGRKGYPTRRPLHQFNTVLTPHYSGATAESRVRALDTVGDNLRRLYAGRPLTNLVHLDEGF